MFSAEAHSFKQQARLAVTLAWVAGYTNVLTILTCGVVTSHVSGTTSNLGRDVVGGRWNLAAAGALLLVAFLIGAAFSTVCTERARRRGWESIYVLPMAMEAGFLLIFALGLEILGSDLKGLPLMILCLSAVAAAAMGMQNATITRISSGVVRTTHVTGVLTDFGIELVQFLLWFWDKRHDMAGLTPRGMAHGLRTHPPARRLFLLASIIGTFALGAGLGALAHDHFLRFAMFPPVLFLLWVIYQDIHRPIAELEPSPLTGAGNELDLPEALAVYHLRPRSSRPGVRHHLPNLTNWARRLPETSRVVVLDIGSESPLHIDAAEELRALLLRMRLEGRRLILAGVGTREAERLMRVYGNDLLPGDVCPDLETAIVHGILLLENLGN